MSRTLLSLLENKLVQHAISANRPSLATDGVDISSWRIHGQFSVPLAAVFIDGDQALDLSSPTGGTEGVELWGYRLSQWWRIGVLHNGSVIALAGNLQGFVQQIQIIGIFDRLAIAATPSVGAVVAKFGPIDQWTTP